MPIANLFIPYHVVAQVTRSSATPKAIWLVYGWWIGYFGQILGLGFLFTDNGIPLMALISTLWLIAGCFLAAIVAKVTAGQQSRLASQG